MEKLCNHCKETKPTSEFHRDKSKTDGLNAYCKPCTIKRQREFFARPPRFKAPEGFKKCQHCKEVLGVSEFFNNKNSFDGLTKNCKSCSYKSQNNWRIKNLEKCAKDQKMRRDRDPERFKDYMRKQYYGLPPGEYDKLLASQNGCCAICKTKTPGGKGGFHIDHCHNSKIVRGLLCLGCNTGLGKFKDSVEVLTAAIQYLKKKKGGPKTP